MKACRTLNNGHQKEQPESQAPERRILLSKLTDILFLNKISGHEKRPERKDPGKGESICYFACKPTYQGNGKQDWKSKTELSDTRRQIPPDDQRNQIPADIVWLDQSEGSIFIQAVKKEQPVEDYISGEELPDVELFSCEKAGDKSKCRHME